MSVLPVISASALGINHQKPMLIGLFTGIYNHSAVTHPNLINLRFPSVIDRRLHGIEHRLQWTTVDQRLVVIRKCGRW